MENSVHGNHPEKSCQCISTPDTDSAMPSCCGPKTFPQGGEINENVPGFSGWRDTPVGRIARIATGLTFSDRAGGWLVRWGIGRMSYLVPAGIYAVGQPSAQDPVLVTANYKMSFDIVRSQLVGRNVWILVLETYGVNVWCAAGKGTFGTAELVRRIRETGLSRLVSHAQVLVPILGAPGMAAHEVRKQCGFTVRYVSVRAADLPEYLDNGMVTTPRMRQLTFSLRERLVLIPVELVLSWKPLAVIGLLLLAVPLLLGYPSTGVWLLVAFYAAALTGLALTPLLLPWLPGRYFSLKGAVAGLVLVAGFLLIWPRPELGLFSALAAFLIFPAVSAYYALNFTGCTPYTSRSGVKKEMRVALPIMAGCLALGAMLALIGLFY